ncbi:MAG: GNAT family N-acetyltransferase [Anaerolineae bacterium]
MQRQLANGLILRSISEGYARDYERLAQFYVDVFTDAGSDSQEEKIVSYWTRDLLDGHPTVTHDDLFVVVDPAHDDKIVSATVLIPQRWHYEEVEMWVGRPELVATTREYRRRGLIRAQFEAMHERCAALGINVLGITGNSHFYRQFGYTMAVELEDHAAINTSLIKKPDNLRFTLRMAAEADAADLAAWTAYFARQRLLSVVYDESLWRYEISGKLRLHPWYMPPFIIVDETGAGVGYVVLRDNDWHERISCMMYVVGEQSSYLETFNDVLYGIKQWATERFGSCPPRLTFYTGLDDTISDLIERHRSGAVYHNEEVWYLRVVDLTRFLREITPVLERRLHGSGANRYTGTLAIGFYNYTGITLHFDKGHLVQVISGALDEHDADVSLPGYTLWDLIFGYRTLDELRFAHPEVLPNPKAAVLLSILFPKQLSWLIPFA